MCNELRQHNIKRIFAKKIDLQSVLYLYIA